MQVLLLMLLLTMPLAVSRYLSPAWLRWCAARLLSRAEALEAGRAAHAQALTKWNNALQIEEA